MNEYPERKNKTGEKISEEEYQTKKLIKLIKTINILRNKKDWLLQKIGRLREEKK